MRTETDFEQVIAQIFTDRIGISGPFEATRVVIEYVETFPSLSTIAAQLYLHVVNIGLLTVAETQVEAQIGIGLVKSIQLAGLQCLVVIGQCRQVDYREPRQERGEQVVYRLLRVWIG